MLRRTLNKICCAVAGFLCLAVWVFYLWLSPGAIGCNIGPEKAFLKCERDGVIPVGRSRRREQNVCIFETHVVKQRRTCRVSESIRL
jgi:hypothetical protein